MRLRASLALATTFVAVGIATAEPPKPTAVVRTQPVARLLTESKEVVRQVGGPVEGDRLVKQFEQALRDAGGEKGFEGLDINRPLAAYVVLRDDLDDAGVVLVVPVSGEKEFVAFLDRLQVKAVAEQGKKGLYRLEFPDPDLFPKPSHLRFADGGWAYIGLNGEAVDDAKNLIPARDLLDPADQSLVSAKLFPGRVPEKLLAHWLDELDNAAKAFKGFVAGGGVPPEDTKTVVALLDHGPKLVRRYAETGIKEAAEVGLRLDWDPKTGDAAVELTVVPKPGTTLAKDIAAQAATTNRFAGLITKDTAAAALLKFPLVKELQAITVAQMEEIQEQFQDLGLPEAFQPLVEEYVKGAIRTAKKGAYDQALALLGPNKDGQFTVVAGLSFDDPSGLDKALRKVAKTPEFAKYLELDVAKFGEGSAHKVKLGELLPPEVADEIGKAFGKDASLYLAFAKDAAFLAYGPDAVPALRSAVAAKPGPVPLVDVVVNMNRVHKLVSVFDEGAGAMVAKYLGTDDKAVSALRLSVAGGATLKVKATLNVRYIPRLIAALVLGRQIDEPEPRRR